MVLCLTDWMADAGLAALALFGIHFLRVVAAEATIELNGIGLQGRGSARLAFAANRPANAGTTVNIQSAGTVKSPP